LAPKRALISKVEKTMTDLNSLTIFAKVVEANSFSEAARRLKLPTSTVSRRVADLEDQLGVRLLVRSTRSLRLTDVGSEVLEHAQHSAELSEAVDNIASNHLSNVSGTLRLSAPPSISDSLLSPMICAFQASYPDVRVQIFVTERFVDHIAEGSRDRGSQGACRRRSLPRSRSGPIVDQPLRRGGRRRESPRTRRVWQCVRGTAQAL